ncbi:LOW QUALITY PROTEIN: nidogen-2 [Neosynchiropus ocellatus]
MTPPSRNSSPPPSRVLAPQSRGGVSSPSPRFYLCSVSPGSTMERERMLALFLLSCCMSVVTAIQRADLFPYGSLSGDSILAEGDDETSQVLSLPRHFYFYNSFFSKLYVATNGIISAQDLPMEKQYVDDGFPTDFPVVAPFLADIDTSKGQGHIYYRVTETPSVLIRVAQEVHRGFPDAKFTPTHAVVATWENVAAYEEQSQTTGASSKLNTFQAVIGYDEADSYVLFLYPEGGLNFFGTRPKESYNVDIEIPARVGFSRGEISYLIFSRTEGPHHSVTSDVTSVQNLYKVGNTGTPGVWLFHTGSRYSFDNIVPASIGGFLVTTPPLKPGTSLETTTPEYAEFEEYSHNNFEADHQEEEEEDDDYPLTGGDPEFHPAPDVETLLPQAPQLPASPSEQPDYKGPHASKDAALPPEPRYSSEGAVRSNPPPTPAERAGAQRPEEQQPKVPLEAAAVYPPHGNEPPLTPGGHVVTVEDDVDFDTGVIQYTTENKETCARFRQQCSQNAFCSDYATGFCCHCSPGFYGNGRHCLPDGAPQRVSGKLSGTVTVGSSPVELSNIDLHAYIVVGDGRAYTAISEVPETVGWALMSVAPIGELFGWLFALELPNSQAGFKITGAEFTRHAEMIFYPGNQRVTIVQTGRGLDDHNHLTVDTVVNGNVPFLPPGAEITMEPFKETYQYYPSVATSTSVREYSVVSADRGSESFSFQLKQNITYRDCRHDNRAAPVETLQITMERVFVMYVKEERILRYAITNKISPVGAESTGPELVNPCYAGNHDCDTTAQCVPLEGQAFQCQCATGYTGDGRNCYDVDECAEGLALCGAHAQCVNLPGSHRCQCQSGFEFGTDGRTCVATERTERPKSQCEMHRDSLQSSSDQAGQPSVGAFIPQCDSDGRYRTLQCHGSTGHCWCVDKSGQERAGTRTPPGTARRDCDKPDEPERPKTHCQHHRDSVQTTSPEGYPILGAYVPQCDDDGQYIPLQCHGSTGHCWCVDKSGQERAGTRTPPGTARRDCDKPDEPERPKTHCQHHRDSVQTTSPEGYPILGAYVPQCDDDGQYIPLQCHGSTGHCWCVDKSGQERAGTRTPPGTARRDCDKPERPKTHCQHHRDSVQTTSPEGYPILGAYVPQCDDDGQYIPLQCHGSTGHCWCVDKSGQERAGTRTPPGTARRDCDKPDEPERPKTHCQHHRDSVQTTSPEGYPIVGAYVPQCDDNGQYSPQQCHGSTGYCWCVDKHGQEIAGTRTPPGSASPVDCNKPDEPVRPKTHCEQHRDNVKATSPDGYPIPGLFVPQCDAQGQYVSRQCHGSTGHCWCVDTRGQERPGTRTPPGSDPKDCDQSDERPKTHCERHRDGVQTTSPEGYPLVGVYVPECDDDGQYLPLQCHGSTGHCWCVDNNGQERPGTKTPPGTAPRDCGKPDEPERPKTYCEHHRDSVQTTSPDGYPIIGVFVPQCDDNGQYTPQQCDGSSGHCWCVDSQGQERPGTRTPPGTDPRDCDKPDEPVRPKTQCEHHRDSIQTTSPEGYPLSGVFVPLCDENGHYAKQQCHGSTGHCWCVDSQGQELGGTRTPPGVTPEDCDKPDEPERPKTHCEQHRDSVQTTSPDGYPLAGVFVPQCDENGHYAKQQCHGSTGHCWCVDNRGEELAGTRTPPGSTRKDCDKPGEPERPKTHCEHHRDRVQTTSSEGYPILGVYVPQCDSDGRYRSRQCHGSTGECWCVTREGQERAGTRTSPDATPVDCDRQIPVYPTLRPESVCERWRTSLIEHYGGKPDPQQYLPQCEPDGQFSPVQCYGATTYCWCVDQDGREVPGTRSHDVVKPACLPSVAPPTVGPVTLPNVTPPPNTGVTLLYAQGQKIGALPLNGTKLDPTRSKTLLTLHGSIVVGLSFDCKDGYVYWTDLSARTINRASMSAGAEPEILINTNLISPEGLAVDVQRRLMFWVDSNQDLIEVANLDGSGRRTLFDKDLVNPRAIIVVSSTGTLYWTDWNREAPKIESASVDGQNRRVVVSEGIGLPNALTYDSSSGQICWADAGTKRLECVFPDGSGRQVIHPTLNYPFSMVYYRNHFYYTDWRRDGVIAVNKDSSQFTDEYLPDQRSHLYGIAIATTHCLSGCLTPLLSHPDPSNWTISSNRSPLTQLHY